MTFVGDRGSAAYPTIKRVKLIDGETYLKHGPSQSWLTPRSEDNVSHWKARGRGDSFVQLSSINQWGLTSRSESMFPEAFKPIDTKFWVPLSQEERSILVAAQAAANAKATWDDDKHQLIAHTTADEQYMDAQSRRSEAIRRRRKPRNYDERKKDEELAKELPLARKYTGPAEAFFRESSAIVKSGPLDTPILAQGLPVFGRNKSEPAPQKLQAKRGRRRRKSGQESEPQTDHTEVGLPSFSLLAAPKTRLIRQNTNNPFGLKSRSEMMYPEAYSDISTIFWRQLSNEERGQIMTVQARAMEKVGYEAGTTKHFIEEIFPEDDYVVRKGGRTDDTSGGGRTIDVEWLIGIVLILVFVGILATNVLNNDGISLPPSGSSSAGEFGGD